MTECTSFYMMHYATVLVDLIDTLFINEVIFVICYLLHEIKLKSSHLNFYPLMIINSSDCDIRDEDQK